MKMIRLYAYLYHNLGDDLMVEVLLKRYGNMVFYCDCDAPIRNKRLISYPNFVDKEKLYEKYGRLNHILNILTLHRNDGFFFRWLFKQYERKCKCSVYVGGSLYMPRSNESIDDRILREKRKMEQSPLFVIGTNFGEEEKVFENAFKEYFSQCGGVSFRDKASYDKFSSLPNTQYAPDVVFNYDIQKSNNSLNRDTVLISVIDFYSRPSLFQYADTYDRLIVEVCETCVRQNKTPVLVSFCELEGDTIAIERIYSLLPKSTRENTQSVFYRNNLPEVLNAFAGASYVIATRFHSMILALKFQKPLFCISYNEKVKQVIQDMGADCFCDLDQINKITMDDVFAGITPPNIEVYSSQASKQFVQLDRYIDSVK